MNKAKPFTVYVLVTLHLILGMSASGGGFLLMLKPDGSLLQMQEGWLKNSPFENYLIPGAILFLLLGVFPFWILYGLIFKPSVALNNKLNIYSSIHWAWTYSLYEGIIVITWIVVQMIFTGYFWLQPVIILIGLLIIIFTMMPQTIKHFSLNNISSSNIFKS